MPIYDYTCEKCGGYDVFKSIKTYDGKDPCPKCGTIGERDYSNYKAPMLIGTAVQSAEYNPGLGCVVRNKNHRAEICKQRGLEEVGNEKVSNLRKSAKETRESRIKKKYLSDTDLRHLAETMRE